MNYASPVSSLKGFGPKKSEAFAAAGIRCLEDALSYYPRSYEDMRSPRKVCDCRDGEKVLTVCRVLSVQKGRGYGRKRTLHLLTEDDTGRMEVLFFMAGYMQNAFTVGEIYYFFGKVKAENGRVTMFHPDFGLWDDSCRGILPVYRVSRGFTQKDCRKLTSAVFALPETLPETLPESVRTASNLCSNLYAYKNIHYPEDEAAYQQARYRLVYEELFDLKTALTLSAEKGKVKNGGIAMKGDGAFRFAESLPYELTGAQKRVLQEVVRDMESSDSMNRLVQGDVGSGKTIIAEAALLQAVFSGYQGLFMAPTEILAGQHFDTLQRDLAPYGLHIVLLTSSLPAKERRQALEALRDGSAQIAVGTHALISEGVEYKNAGLVITDEQHRFGVSQREKLAAKGRNPDVLVMTATPIPRTLALVLYADLDISVIDEMPPGRKPIQTFAFQEKERKKAYQLLFEEVEKGRQAYIVAPFIDDSESVDGRSAETLYEAFVKKHPEIPCGLLHGAMPAEEKDRVMLDFYAGKISVLISTVVIEVGINVPNASVMLIENCERFGLAQMHQLRGRVGRGEYESYCLLCSGSESEVSRQRSEILCSTGDGFLIAEKDLEIRGPGEFFGYRQHGLPQLVLADPVKHAKIAEKAGEDARKLLASDPTLSLPENAVLKDKIKKKYLQVDNITI